MDSGPGAGRTVLVVFHDTIAGGAILSVLRLVEGLEALGWRFEFWAPAPSPLADELRAAGRRVHGADRQIALSAVALRLPPGPRQRLASVPPYLGAFRRTLREVGPALVHANSFPTAVEGVAARAVGVPTVLHVHEILPAGRKGAVAARLASAGATRQIAVSRAVGKRLRGEWLLVHEGAEAPAEAPDRSGRETEPFTVGTVGVISRRKGSDVFVEAAAIVRERDPGIRFEMVGAVTEPLDAEWAAGVLRRAAEAGVVHVESTDVAAALGRWDAFALPSRRDPCPISLLEAMASGLPVVGACVDGIPEEIVPGTGLLVAPEDPEHLARAILELRALPDRGRAIGEAARERARTEFSIERQVEGVNAAYLAALGERKTQVRHAGGGRRAAGVDSRTVMLALHEDVLGGASLAATRVVPLLEERGWRFVVWAPDPSPLAGALREQGVEVRGLERPVQYSLESLRLPPGPRARLTALPGYLRAFARVVDEVGPAVVHANTIYCLPELAVARRRAPAVIHVHEMLDRGLKAALSARAAGALADEVVAVSAACAAVLARHGVAASVVHGGVPLDRFRPAPPDADPGPAFGMVGALSRRKGIDVFAEAARLVRAEVPEARFELVGGFTEPLDAEWAGSVLARANGAVEHVEGADVAAVLPGWAALAVPSRADPFPNVVLEGMAAGLPVVGSRVDGIVEQVTPETGVLVRADDPRALAEALLALHRDPERRRAMGAAARARAESEFSLERQAAGLESAYLRAIGARRR